MDTKNKDIKLNAVVIEERDYKEYDKLVTLLTDKLGKINVYCFNVRRKNAKNISKTSLFSFGEYRLKETSNGYSLYEASIKEHFDDLAKDYNKYLLACDFIKCIEYFSMENIEDDKLLKLFVYTLKALKDGIINTNTIRNVFKTKLLMIEGFGIESLDLNEDLDEKIKFTYNEIEKRELKKLYSFDLSEEINHKLSRFIDREYKNKIGKFYD